MITAENFLLNQGIVEENLQNLPWFDYGNILTWLEEFAKEAIKADRIELAKLVDKRLENESQIRAFLIDGTSIINAPNIQLL